MERPGVPARLVAGWQDRPTLYLRRTATATAAAERLLAKARPIDITDVDYNYQGQRCGRPHVAAWAEMATTLAADLMAGDEAPPTRAELLRRAVAALPAPEDQLRRYSRNRVRRAP